MPRQTSIYRSSSDEELFALVKNNNRVAFEEIYNRHCPALLEKACRSLQSRQKAEDVVQELFLSLYQKRETLEFTHSLQAYLRQALKFKMLNEFRSRNIRLNYYKNFFFTHDGKYEFTIEMEAKETKELIRKSITKLPGKCREVFLLSRNENLSYKAISGGLGISVSTVEKHIIKALKLLKNNLNFEVGYHN